jgi:hypothetical protein
MSATKVTQEEVLKELSNLEPSRWPEVLDFIGTLREQGGRDRAIPEARELTAQDLVQSAIVGMWMDRDDIQDSPDYARQLRRQAERRRRLSR